jgi:4-amino-4-deoxy-L-arabinose transferase-like glycosyltransferase
VNNLSFHHQCDYSFAASSSAQDQYRMLWAIAALPLTLPLSWVQRLLGSPPEDVGLLVRAAAAVIGFLGVCVAACGLSHASSGSLRHAMPILALTSVFPPFLLNIRTGFPNHTLAFLLSWAAIALTLGYCRTSEPSRLYLLAVVLVYFALTPYPPLLVLPILLLGLLISCHRLRTLLRTPACYAAALTAVALYLAGNLLFARVAGLPVVWYRAAVTAFRAMRGGAVPWANARIEEIPSRLQFFFEQQALFTGRSRIIRSGRPDALWSLGSLHVTWLLVLALGVAGVVVGIQQRDRRVMVTLAVLVTATVVLCVVGVPESRYLLVVAPCYAALAVRALDLPLLSGRAGAYLWGVIVVAVSLNSYVWIAKEYTPRMDRTWPQMDGIEEFARFLHGRWTEGIRYVALPYPRTYEANLCLRMFTNNNAEWVGDQELERKLEASDRLRLPKDRWAATEPGQRRNPETLGETQTFRGTPEFHDPFERRFRHVRLG